MPTLRSRPASNLDQSSQTEKECTQVWPDGSIYRGFFKDGRRHGHGEERWPNGEVYTGEFVNDKKEGKGIYYWPDGSRFVGNFKSDRRSGFGRIEYKNGNFFEGIYQNDVRDGPGIFTYITEQTQDVGIWLREKIYRICTRLGGSFTFKQYSQHFINAGSRSITPVNGQKHKEKHENAQSPLWEPDGGILEMLPDNFKYKDLVCCVRKSFQPKGYLEELSERLIHAAIEGDVVTTTDILRRGDIHPDVTDSTGFSAMLAAAVNCHGEVINCLLDFGANVNILNTEGLSPLAACHVLQYTSQDFLDNIAEVLPKENTFNSIELDKQRGNWLHRNDRKAILSMYGTPRSQSNEPVKPKNGRNMSSRSTRDSIMNGELLCVETPIDEDERDQEQVPENWKLTFYQRTLSRSDKLDAITQNFSKLKGKPYDFENAKEELEPGPLSILAAEKIAQEAGDSEAVASKKCELTDASIYCGESSFGHAPKVEISAEDAKKRLLNAERKPHLKATISLLLERGADPNASSLPMPVLFFAVKAADIKACEALLSKGADTSIRLDPKDLGLAPLHIAVALPCQEGIEITRLLLESNANPDLEDLAFGQSTNGRTALHIACTREDDNKIAQKVASCLLQYNANPNLLCQGHSPLSLAISSGNDLVVEALLKALANPSLRLSNGVGSALCSATTFTAERRRVPSDRVKLIDKLVKAGADLLAPIHIFDKGPAGTAVDYAHYVFNQDRRIAHTPYHALNALERACHNSRKEVLEHLGHLLRTAALKREKQILEAELKALTEPEPPKNPDAPIVVASECEILPHRTSMSSKKAHGKDSGSGGLQKRPSRRDSACGLPFAVLKLNDPKASTTLGMNEMNQKRLEAKRRFRYCYECGRSMGLRLTACTRCKEVFFCSKICKLKAWNVRHKDECARISGRRSASTSYEHGRTMGSSTPNTEGEEVSTKHITYKTVEMDSAKSLRFHDKKAMTTPPNKTVLQSAETFSLKSALSSNARSVKPKINNTVSHDLKNSKPVK